VKKIAKISGWIEVPRLYLSEPERKYFIKKYTYVNGAYEAQKRQGIVKITAEPTVAGYVEDDKTLYLPRGAMSELKRNGWGFVDERLEGRVLSRNVTKNEIFKPKEEYSQQEFVGALVAALVAEKSAFGVAFCGFGKTIVGAEIIRRLSRSTLIIVHRDFLSEQWIEAINMILPNAKIGKVRQDRCDTGEDFDIVIASLQSLAVRDYGEDFYNSFGLVLSDESHILGAKTWQEVLPKFPAMRRLLLTATPERKDNLHQIFFNHVCEPTYTAENISTDVKVYQRKTGLQLETWQYVNRWNQKVNRGRLIKAMVNDDKRNIKIVTAITDALLAGRQAVVLSDSREHLKMLEAGVRDRFKKETVPDIVYFVGAKSKKEKAALVELRKVLHEKDLILATWQMAALGLNVPTLDTLFMATPRSAIQQAVGRIIREVDDKKTPLVVDFVDENIKFCVGLMWARQREYRKLGYEGEFLKKEDLPEKQYKETN